MRFSRGASASEYFAKCAIDMCENTSYEYSYEYCY